MNYFKKIGISLLYSFASLFILTFIITFLNYINLFNYNVFKVFKIIVLIISFFIGGFIIGKKSIKKRYLEGLKFGLINLILFIILNLLFNDFNIKDLIYYLIIIGSTTIGSMLNLKKEN